MSKKGYKQTESHRKNISIALSKHKRTEEHKRHLIENQPDRSGKNNSRWVEKVLWSCKYCKTIKYLTPNAAKRKTFCSLQCKYDAGYSKETKEKMRQGNLGNKSALGNIHSKESKEKNRQAHLNKILTKEHCKKISESLYIKKPTILQLKKRLFRETHSYIINMSGPAKYYLCVDCGKQAHDWSNVNNHKYQKKIEDFVPRCQRCHAIYDSKNRKQ